MELLKNQIVTLSEETFSISIPDVIIRIVKLDWSIFSEIPEISFNDTIKGIYKFISQGDFSKWKTVTLSNWDTFYIPPTNDTYVLTWVISDEWDNWKFCARIESNTWTQEEIFSNLY